MLTPSVTFFLCAITSLSFGLLIPHQRLAANSLLRWTIFFLSDAVFLRTHRTLWLAMCYIVTRPNKPNQFSPCRGYFSICIRKLYQILWLLLSLPVNGSVSLVKCLCTKRLGNKWTTLSYLCVVGYADNWFSRLWDGKSRRLDGKACFYSSNQQHICHSFCRSAWEKWLHIPSISLEYSPLRGTTGKRSVVFSGSSELALLNYLYIHWLSFVFEGLFDSKDFRRF